MNYDKEIAKVNRASLGFEDHGLFGWNIDFDLGSASQGTGWRMAQHESTGFLIPAILNAFGVDDWSELKGVTVFVLRKEGDPYGMIRGVEKLPTEKRGGRIIFEEFLEELEAKQKASA